MKSNVLAYLMLAIGVIINSSCSGIMDEPDSNDTSSRNVSEAEITFTYTVPEELFRYAEITVCYNNNAGTDALWTPMLDRVHTVTYNITKFPVTAPVVMVYKTTNRPAYGVNVDWKITMNVTVKTKQDGQITCQDYSEDYIINGDLGVALANLQRNVLDRTYAIKMTKAGDISFVH